MKRILLLLLTTVVVTSLAACAAPTGKTSHHSYQSIKYPSLGYNFDAPADN